MLAANTNASPPFSLTYMNYVASPTRDYHKAVGWSSQLVSPPGEMKEQGCGCTNHLSQRMMEYREWTNVHSQNWNMHAKSMHCSASAGFDHASNGTGFFTPTSVRSPHKSMHSSASAGFDHASNGTAIFSPTSMRSPLQGVIPQQYICPRTPFNTHLVCPQVVPKQLQLYQSSSSSSSCSGLMSLNGEQSNCFSEIYPQEIMGYPNGNSQNLSKQINSVYLSDSHNHVPSSRSLKQQKKVYVN